MLFNSTAFLVFLPTVLAVYYALGDTRRQNLWLMAASLFFYAAWDWRFVFLLLFTVVIDFCVARRIQALRDRAASQTAQRLWLTASLIANIGVLAFFKYYNFFQANTAALSAWLHISATAPVLDVLLPIGVSFYTFQSMSYTIDVYRGHIRAAGRFTDFVLFVSFFPHLVAGPIMRAVDLLPQIMRKRDTTRVQVAEGIHLIIWGFWKKMFVADNLAPIVNDYFSRTSFDGWHVLIGAYAFAFQIYGDFSGYTDIARGVAKLMGFELTLNFNLPYLSASPQEFWTRWHISLSRWLREYVYFPLGGNRHGSLLTYRNLMLTMVIGGLWHGAAWNFVLWGVYQGVLLVTHRALAPLLERIRLRTGVDSKLAHAFNVALMFEFTCYGWLLFRAESLTEVVAMTRALAGPWHVDLAAALPLLYFAGPLVTLELIGYAWERGPALRWPQWRIPLEARVAGYSVLAYLTIFLAAKPQRFIYFSF